MQVRLNVISTLSSVNAVIGIELLSQSLLPAIIDLAADLKWRVRVAIIEHIPMIAQQLGSSFFNERLNTLCMTWLGDNVYSVRRAATENLQKLTERFGDEWACEQIVPRVNEMHIHTNYLQRMTALYCIQVLSVCLSKNSVENTLASMVLKLCGDSVANVRFTAARTLPMISASKELRADVFKSLQTLQTDLDRDVRFFATQVLSL